MRCVYGPLQGGRCFIHVPTGDLTQGWQSFADMLRELLKLKDDLEKTSKQRLITDLRDDSQKRTSYVDVVKKDRAINYSILPVKNRAWTQKLTMKGRPPLFKHL